MSTNPMPGQKLASFADFAGQVAAISIQAGPTVTALAVSSGTFTADGANSVVVAAPYVTANSQILITIKTPGGTPNPSRPNVIALNAGVGFTVDSIALDTSVYNWTVIG